MPMQLTHAAAVDVGMSTRKLYYERLIRFKALVSIGLYLANEIVVAKVTASVCDYPHPDRSSVLVAMTAAMITATSIFILLRLTSKGWISGGLQAEDWIIASALLLSFVSVYFTVVLRDEGFGKHIWDINDGDLSGILQNSNLPKLA
jgi:hypothetical protein